MAEVRREVAISLGLAAVVMAVAGSLLWDVLSDFKQNAERERKYLTAQAEADRALRSAREQLELAQRVSGEYFALQGSGIFNPINKTAAIDRAEASLRPYAVAVTRYQIGGGHETAPAPDERIARYQLDIQRVAIEFEPLHEERFVDVWNAISALRGVAGSVESCELHRPAEANAQERARQAMLHDTAPNPLKARCLLTWYRLQAAPSDAAAAAAPAGPGVHS